MGFYVRQSVAVGPFRFNLSKSGVGLSVGVKGLRLGTGPRGNYVHMGAGGLYYRATLPTTKARPNRRVHEVPLSRNDVADPAPSTPTHGPAVAIESAETSTIVDSSSRALLDELKQKQSATPYWPIVLGASCLLFLMGYSGKWPTWTLALIAVGGAAATYAMHAKDAIRKTVVIFYEFESNLESAFRRLHQAGTALAQCGGRWHIGSSAKVHDGRYHAGAASLIARKPTIIGIGTPPIVTTNVDTLAIGVGKQTLHFFPDRVLIFEGINVGAVGYRELGVDWDSRQFVEDGSVPSDAKVVGQTWRYPNKDGSPDRRFKDNRQIPVCLYGQLAFTSRSGLNELVQVSRSDVVAEFAAALKDLGKALPAEHT